MIAWILCKIRARLAAEVARIMDELQAQRWPERTPVPMREHLARLSKDNCDG